MFYTCEVARQKKIRRIKQGDLDVKLLGLYFNFCAKLHAQMCTYRGAWQMRNTAEHGKPRCVRIIQRTATKKIGVPRIAQVCLHNIS
jgi:hypothetical protein